ncbi:MAG: 50S ribosomal protein L11 methyltransferase [Oligoflexia bacterium]|nr:50S ribosomal protein L11 methyltransferase [Oligoflexia bacterium]
MMTIYDDDHYFILSLEIQMKKWQLVAGEEGDDSKCLALEGLKQLAIESFGCQGIEEYGLDEAEVDDILGERAYSGGDIPWEVLEEVEKIQNSQEILRYKFYFCGEQAESAAQKFAAAINSIVGFAFSQVSIEKKLNEEWNKSWEKHYRPIKISSLLEVVPSFYQGRGRPREEASDRPIEHSAEHPAQHSIYIYPGMGFGTGEHQTTQLCLELLSSLHSSCFLLGGRCLDFGCGSGILGIAASKLGYREVVLCDVDQAALDNSQQNLECNFLSTTGSVAENKFLPQLMLVDHDLGETGSAVIPALLEGKFNLIFANILMNVLIAKRDFLLSKLAKEGFIILSGLLKEQVAEVREFYLSANSCISCVVIAEECKGEWAALTLQRVV